MADDIQRPALPAPEDMPHDRNLGDGLCIMVSSLALFSLFGSLLILL